MIRRAIALTVLVAGMLAVRTTPAAASFPGRNGEIAWAYYTMPDEDEGITDYGFSLLIGGQDRTLYGCAKASCAQWSDPDFSPNGSRLLWDEANGQIVVANPSGGDRHALPTGGWNASNPTVSPDGKRIAYLRWHGTSGDFQIVTSTLSGADVQIVSRDRFASDPQWSPTGQTLLYQQHSTIWSVSATGGHPTAIIPDGIDAAWSPDGQEIAYVGYRSGWIYLATASGQDRRRLPISGWCTPPGCQADAVVFSPDGTKLAFDGEENAYGDAQPTLYTVPAAGGAATEIATEPADDGGGATTGLAWQALP